MIHMGDTPGPLRGPSGAPPSGNVACEASESRKEVPGAQDEEGSGILTSASKPKGYGTRVEALPAYYRGKTAAGSRAVPEGSCTSGSYVMHAM
jgi:hypothetical protein